MPRWLRAVLVAAIGGVAILLAYRAATATTRNLTTETDRLNQQYRCLLARGRSLRGATFADCRAYR